MYVGFHLKWSDRFVAYRSVGEQLFKEQKQHLKMNLDKYVNPDTGALVGKALEEDWFPVSAYDIFISHSHDDMEQAIALAGWLKETFHLSVFIDAAVWGSADTLLKEIDDRCCLLEENSLYDYHQRNYSTSHVHMLVAMALAKVIDKSECFMFLNTSNLLQLSEQTVSQSTTSPWIYGELVLSQLMEKRKPERFDSVRFRPKRDVIRNQGKQLEIEHDVHSPLNDLMMLNEENLNVWEQSYQKNSPCHALDYLYGQLRLQVFE